VQITPQHLADLGRLLRAEGFTVTADHELKLQAVFRLFADVEPARVRRLVAPVVLEAPDQAEALEAVLDRWLPGVQAPAEVGAVLPTALSPVGEPRHSSPPPGRSVRGLWLALAALSLVVLVCSVVLLPDAGQPDAELPRAPAHDAGPLDEGLGGGALVDAGLASMPDAAPGPTGTYPAPSVIINEHQPTPRGWLGALALLSLLGAAALSLKRRDDGLPDDLPPPDNTSLAPPARARADRADAVRGITTVDDRRALVWGVDHFLSDDESHRLDLRASVRATARAADRPVTVFARERRARAIWLWIDADAQSDAPERLAAELAATLTANGLDVHRAWFEGVPDVLFVNGSATDPDDLGTPIQGSVVAVLTDGRALQQIDPSVAQATLAGLSLWPHLAVVDFADGATDLVLRLRPHGVQVIAPEALARWLGGEDGGPPGEVDLTAWLAACALAPTPVDPTDVLELGQIVGVPTPARHLPAIEADAQRAGARLSWPWLTRAARLDWLGGQPDLLQRAVDQWTLRHAPGAADTATNRARAMERAIVQLWTRPDAVAEVLYTEPSQRPRVETWLRGLDTADAPARPGVARLPWTWADVTAQTQQLLRARGFGGQILLPPQPRKPWWAIGALSVAALVALVLWLIPQAVPKSRFSEVGERPADAVVRIQADGTLAAGIRQGTFTAQLPAGAHGVITWGLFQNPCQRFEDTPDGPAEHWMCLGGQRAQHPAWRSGKPGRDLVLPFESTDDTAAQLARRALETGAADTVIFGPSALDPLRERWVIAPKVGAPDACVGADLCLRADDLNALASTLGAYWRPANEIWPGARGAGAQTMQIPGGGPSDPTPIAVGAVTPRGDGWLDLTLTTHQAHQVRTRFTDTADGSVMMTSINATHAASEQPVPRASGGQQRYTVTPIQGGVDLAVHYDAHLPASTLNRIQIKQDQGQLRLSFPPGPPHPDAVLAWIAGDQLKLSRPIRFELDATQLRLDQRPMLQAVATLLETEVPKHRLRITGHSAEPETKRRSLKRAQAVRTYLVNAGISRTRLEVKGVGDGEPLAKGDTERARAQNRRAELTMLLPARPKRKPTALSRSEIVPSHRDYDMLLSDARKLYATADHVGAIGKLEQALKVKKGKTAYQMLCVLYPRAGRLEKALTACKMWKAKETHNRAQPLIEEKIQQLEGQLSH
jgi:outer membrane protein OmpA-like peptidoglycan-associated protein